MSIETLVRDHAMLADKVRELKSLGEQSAGSCTRRKDPALGDNCIGTIFGDWKDYIDFEGDHTISFDQCWSEARAAGDACDACQEVRNLKAERMKARRRLGAVRAAITRVGRTLAASSQGEDA